MSRSPFNLVFSSNHHYALFLLRLWCTNLKNKFILSREICWEKQRCSCCSTTASPTMHKTVRMDNLGGAHFLYMRRHLIKINAILMRVTFGSCGTATFVHFRAAVKLWMNGKIVSHLFKLNSFTTMLHTTRGDCYRARRHDTDWCVCSQRFEENALNYI